MLFEKRKSLLKPNKNSETVRKEIAELESLDLEKKEAAAYFEKLRIN